MCKIQIRCSKYHASSCIELSAWLGLDAWQKICVIQDFPQRLPSYCTTRCGVSEVDRLQRGKTSAVVLSTDPVDTCKKSCGVPLLLPTSGAVSHHFSSLPVSVPVSAGFKKVVSGLHFFIFVLHEIPCYAEQTVLLERERSLEKKKRVFPHCRRCWVVQGLSQQPLTTSSAVVPVQQEQLLAQRASMVGLECEDLTSCGWLPY